jgi:hypothetical protein
VGHFKPSCWSQIEPSEPVTACGSILAGICMRGPPLGSDMGDNTPHDDEPQKPPAWAVRFSATMSDLNKIVSGVRGVTSVSLERARLVSGAGQTWAGSSW